jgi:hypothetical protein
MSTAAPYLTEFHATTIPVRFNIFSKVFFLETYKTEDYRYIWVYMFGTIPETKNYNYIVKISGTTGSNELTYKDHVQSLGQSLESIVYGKTALMISTAQVDQFANVNGNIHFSVVIESLKEEFKNEDVESGISEDDEDEPESAATNSKK